VFIKICGITNEDDALLSVALGATALGFVFAQSPRRVDREIVKDIVKRVPSEVLTIGVFRNDNPLKVIETVYDCGLSGAQLHGDEDGHDVALVRSKVSFVIKAASADAFSIGEYEEYPCDALLLDSPQPGSGSAFDWSIVESRFVSKPLILAGGLNPSNIEEAVSIVKPFGVDVSSGVEAKLGKKDPVALKSFIQRATTALSKVEAEFAAKSRMVESMGSPYDWEESI
jgi:phosphoribosylanthranilate isomerase